MKLPIVGISIAEDRGTYNYGELGIIRLHSGEWAALCRVGLPADISESAVVTKADVVLHAKTAMTGSRTLTIRSVSGGISVSTSTWNNAPTQTGPSYTETVGTVAQGGEVRIDIIALVQGLISGTLALRGWRLQSDETTTRFFYGPKAAEFQPYLDLEYVEPGDPPGDLHPAGAAVSVAKPTLTFVTAADDITALQVQIDAAEDEVSPDFDSGTVAATAGVLDLTTTAYAGLADGASTSWRARAQGPLGWSGWSDWVSFSRENKTTVTITAPASTSGDKTPPITWTAAGQESWQVFLRDGITGKVLANSGRQTSADLAWTPPKGLSAVGDTGQVEVRVWDDVERVATPGDPDYAVDTQDFTLVAASVAAGVSTLTATITHTPTVLLEWTGAAADNWQIVRNGEWLERIAGTETEYVDYGARPRVANVYKVLRVSGGVVSPNGPSATVTPQPPGAWLVDPETGAMVMLGDEDVEVFMVEQAVLHNIVGGPPVRRRAGTPPPTGAVVGNFVDAYLNGVTQLAADSEAVALSFKSNPQGHVYRLVWADKNYPVTIGDMTPAAFMDGDRQVSYDVSFQWWHTGDEAWMS